jgi:hypothetical protein
MFVRILPEFKKGRKGKNGDSANSSNFKNNILNY